MVKVISFQSARMPMSFRISFPSSVCQHIFLHHAGNVFHSSIKVNKLVISYHPPPHPAYATGDCGNQVFLISQVLTPAIGNNQKCRSPQQAELFMSNPPDVPSFPPSGQRTLKECLFFNFFL